MNSTKEQGIQKVIDNNALDYAKIKAFAYKWLTTRFEKFTSDDLRADYEKENDPPLQPKVYGGVFSSLAKEGLINTDGMHVKSKRKESHNRHIPVWKSLCVSQELKSA